VNLRSRQGTRVTARSVTVVMVWFGCWLALGAMTLSAIARGGSVAPFGMAAVPYAIAGAFVATKVPANRFGWLLYGAALSWAVLATLREGDLPVDIYGGAFTVFYTSTAFILLLLPDGSLPSTRWRPIAWGLSIAAVAVTVTEPTGAWPFKVALVAFIAFGVVAATAPFFRYRRASTTERAQLKWPAYVVVVGVGSVVFAVLLSGIADPVSGAFIALAAAAGMIGLPIAFAVAITRYRLYEIDRIVRRTLVYGLVVATLAVVFVVGAVWIPLLLPTSNNNLAVAATTLVVCLLFHPLRQRVQVLVDRRFYRSRYSAQQVADEFARQLRDELDPRLVAERWAGVVDATMQPRAISFWIA
jgi:hypothetical protein